MSPLAPLYTASWAVALRTPNAVPVAISIGLPRWVPRERAESFPTVNGLKPWGLLDVEDDDEFRRRYGQQLADRHHVIERAGLADLPLAADLEADWPELTMIERRELLRAGLEKVVLSKGRKPIQERAEIVWKGGHRV